MVIFWQFLPKIIVILDRKIAAFEAEDQFLKNSGPVNNPLKSDGLKKRIGEKRKLNVIGEKSEILDSFSPRKIPRKEDL